MFEGRQRKAATALLFLLGVAVPGGAQTPTMGLLLNNPGVFDGYTLFECMGYPVTVRRQR